jgi:hypothetical protein
MSDSTRRGSRSLHRPLGWLVLSGAVALSLVGCVAEAPDEESDAVEEAWTGDPVIENVPIDESDLEISSEMDDGDEDGDGDVGIASAGGLHDHGGEDGEENVGTSQQGLKIWGPRVKPHVRLFANDVCRKFRACKPSTYKGHPSRGAAFALDILTAPGWNVPNTRAGIAKGWKVANYAVQRHYGKYMLHYVIWRGLINFRDGRGWRNYPRKKNLTGNHMDHVHVSFLPKR